jgi:hypothetical protein
VRDTRGWSCPPVLGVPCEMPRQELLCLAALVSPPEVTATRRGMTGRVAGRRCPDFVCVCARHWLRIGRGVSGRPTAGEPHQARCRVAGTNQNSIKKPPETQSPPVRWCQPHPDERGGTTKQGGRFCFCRDWAEQPRGATGGSSNSAPAARPLAARAARVVTSILTPSRDPSRGGNTEPPRMSWGVHAARGRPPARHADSPRE